MIFYKKLNINKELLPTNIKLEAFGGSIIKPLGKKTSIPLLGVQTCESLNLVKRVSNIEFMSSKECFVKNNQEIFNGVVLDLKEGFWQVELDNKSSDLCTFSTPFGKIFSDISGVQIYFDDLLIAANNEKEQDEILSKVINRAKSLGVKFNVDKIQFKVESVKYLGHIFSSQGMEVDPDRIKAILAIENPKNKKDLQ
ncbi:hypothetical protein NQ317_002615, partial [Molorchus minor]